MTQMEFKSHLTQIEQCIKDNYVEKKKVEQMLSTLMSECKLSKDKVGKYYTELGIKLVEAKNKEPAKPKTTPVKAKSSVASSSNVTKGQLEVIFQSEHGLSGAELVKHYNACFKENQKRLTKQQLQLFLDK